MSLLEVREGFARSVPESHVLIGVFRRVGTVGVLADLQIDMFSFSTYLIQN